MKEITEDEFFKLWHKELNDYLIEEENKKVVRILRNMFKEEIKK